MSTGRHYAETRNLNLPEVAQRMRADVAQLKTDGRIPVHGVVSVRIDQQGTSAIDITVSGLRDAEV
jgi:hypothetical protein